MPKATISTVLLCHNSDKLVQKASYRQQRKNQDNKLAANTLNNNIYYCHQWTNLTDM